jgi:2-hydroxy-3-oxopropionate reductase
MNVGFVGLGIMGRPMAANLIKGGQKLFLHTRSTVPNELIKAGGVACESPREVARRAEVIITMLPDTLDVEKVILGKSGIAEGLSPGKIIVDMSSISPQETKRFATEVERLGCEYIDAPVSGGEVGAKAATLSIMCGGKENVFTRIKSLFELMGKNISHIGEVGDGQTTKIANQIIVALTIQAVGEALLFASKSGANPARVREALMGGFASSKILEIRGDRMVRRTFNPGFRIALHQKDLNLALEGAKALGLSLPNTAVVQQLFNACVAHGGASWDHSALVTAVEAMANYRVGEALS